MSETRFATGQRVRIVNRTPHVHHRVPSYVKGRIGVVERVCGVHGDPERFSPGDGEPRQRLYRIRIAQRDLWDSYAGNASDKLDVEIFENWLEATDDHA